MLCIQIAKFNIISLFIVEPHHKKTVIIKLVPMDITKLRYEVTYSNERHSELSISGSIMKLRRINLPVSYINAINWSYCICMLALQNKAIMYMYVCEH